ncbi:MAG: nitronate monooxygenase [Ruminococcus sp.]|nr:nitronate monooxygenase [Ruminococcus sp.]
MEYQPLTIGELVVKKPVLQGGMGIGISLGNLAGAVAKEGGLGVISAAQIGFRDPDFEKNTKEANIRAIQKEYEKARKIAPDGVIGFNMMVAMRHYDEYVQAAVEAGADIIISGAGLPLDLPKLVEGSKTKIAPIVSTEKSANVILRFWDKKYKRVPDLLVIEGPKAGGHLGFDREQLKEFHPEAYDSEVKKILAVVKKYEEKAQTKIPVALAGGITDSEDVAHAFALGVDAVQVASRFVTTEECDADLRFKEAYLQAKEEDIVIVQSPVGMPGRAVCNPFMQQVKEGKKFTPTSCRTCLIKCNPSEIPYCITQALINAAEGNLDEALIFCGANTWKAKKIETVKEVIDSLLYKCV